MSLSVPGSGAAMSGARLDRRADQAIVDEIDRDLVRGRSQRRAHRGFVAARPAKADIAGCRRRAAAARPGACAARASVTAGSGCVIDLDALGRIRRLRKVSAIDHRHRLADMTHRARARARSAAARPWASRRGNGSPTSGRIGAMPSAAMSAPVKTATTPGAAAAAEYVDVANARMRMRRAHEHAMQARPEARCPRRSARCR